MHTTDIATLPPVFNTLLERIDSTGQPECLTVEGAPRMVVQDIAAYRRMAELARQSEDMAAIREGIEQAERGEMHAMDDVFREIAAKYNLNLNLNLSEECPST